MNSKVLRISRARTLQSLQGLAGHDPSGDHEEADSLLVEHLRLIGETQVADEFEKTKKRCRFYYV